MQCVNGNMYENHSLPLSLYDRSIKNEHTVTQSQQQPSRREKGGNHVFPLFPILPVKTRTLSDSLLSFYPGIILSLSFFFCCSPSSLSFRSKHTRCLTPSSLFIQELSSLSFLPRQLMFRTGMRLRSVCGQL